MIFMHHPPHPPQKKNTKISSLQSPMNTNPLRCEYSKPSSTKPLGASPYFYTSPRVFPFEGSSAAGFLRNSSASQFYGF